MYHFENQHEKSCPQKGGFLDEDNWIVICLCTDPEFEIVIFQRGFSTGPKLMALCQIGFTERHETGRFLTQNWSRKIRVGNLSCIITSIFRKSVVL